LQQSPRKIFDLEQSEHSLCVGTDEVGRGPLAGPVVAAAVILPLDFDNPEIRDSKKLSAAKRERLVELIKKEALAYHITSLDSFQIDRLNILQASLMAMKSCVLVMQAELVKQNYWGSKKEGVLVLVDGNQLVPGCPLPQKTVVGGDDKSLSIAAASLLAKVYRDQLMDQYHNEFPQYGFLNNKGYGTAQHRQALLQFGATRIHRHTFLKKILSTSGTSAGLSV